VASFRTLQALLMSLSLLLASCATTYHHAAETSIPCKAKHPRFEAFAECVWAGLGEDASEAELDYLRSYLHRLNTHVRQRGLSDAQAIRRFERAMGDRIKATRPGFTENRYWAMGLAFSALTLVLFRSYPLWNSRTNKRSKETQRDYRGLGNDGWYLIDHAALKGCCTGRGGAQSIDGQHILCANGEPSPTCTTDGQRIQSITRSADRRGCCMEHQGICGWSGRHVLCCDHTPSPICRIR
jgi:hypothetical protein